MKRILAVALIFSAFGASAQQKLIGLNSEQFDQAGTLTGVDSSEYIYNSWGGSIYSNEPQFVFEGSVIDWIYEKPAIRWDEENVYAGFSLVDTWNNTIVGDNAILAESPSTKVEYTYDAAGNVLSKDTYFDNGTVFELSFQETSEYDANGNKIIQQFIYHGGGTPVLENLDSLFYDASNNLTRSISYELDAPLGTLYPFTESTIVYVGSEISNLALFQGSSTSPLEWAFDIDYTYSAGKPTNLTGYQVVGGVPDSMPTVEIDFTYGANNKLSLYQAFLSGDLFNEVAYAYDGFGFVTDITTSELDFATSALYVSEEMNFYYQNTAGIDEVEVAEATVFPNPSSDFVRISAGSEIEKVSVFNANGSIMISQNGGDINISNLPSGVYIVKVETAKGAAQARFVKQ